MRAILVLGLALAASRTADGFPHLTSTAVDAAGGCAYDFCEGLEGPGYENSWTETDTNNRIDDQSTGQVHTGTYSMLLDGDATSTFYTQHDLGTDHNEAYGRLEIYTGSGQSHNENHNLIVYDNSDLEVFFIRWKQQNPGLTILWQANGGSSQSVSGFSEDVFLCIEWHYVDGTLDLQVDDADQTDSTGGNDRNVRKLRIGAQDTDNMDTYVDEIQVEVDTWIGCG